MSDVISMVHQWWQHFGDVDSFFVGTKHSSSICLLKVILSRNDFQLSIVFFFFSKILLNLGKLEMAELEISFDVVKLVKILMESWCMMRYLHVHHFHLLKPETCIQFCFCKKILFSEILTDL